MVLDGEAIALRADGRPEPFQVTARASRASSERDVPLDLFAFDVLHADGEDVLDRPRRRAGGAARRARARGAAHAAGRRVGRRRGAGEFLDDAIARGHEGVMLKALDQPYVAGSRGTGWLKVKPVHTLDLVVLAAEWGHGRRRGWLSNLHLGARDPSGDGFVMLGKTFKGLTDAMLTWQTEKLLAARDRPRRPRRARPPGAGRRDRLRRRPDEPALPGRGRAALRARLRHRPDKSAAEADTLDAVLSVLG